MQNQVLVARWLNAFPELAELEPEAKTELLDATQFNRLRQGDIAYYQGQACQNYVMCIEGQTRIFKTSESGREIMLYQVGPGETCVLTTSCLIAGNPFPAESTAQADVLVAALPASPCSTVFWFPRRSSGTTCSPITAISSPASSCWWTKSPSRASTLRLARRLLAEIDATNGVVSKTHQQLALDLGQRARGDQPLHFRMGENGLGPVLARLHRGAR